MTASCPNCGAQVPPLMATARVAACEYCGTTLLKEDGVLARAGHAGDMFDAPSLFTLNEMAHIGGRTFTPRGHIQYDYGQGVWDEFWGEDAKGQPVWVSVDEGDVVWQKPLSGMAGAQDVFRLGAQVNVHGRMYRTTEVSNATCLAFRGQLPEAPKVGEVHMFANLSGPEGAIVSVERWDGGSAWFEGAWIDPWEVRAP